MMKEPTNPTEWWFALGWYIADAEQYREKHGGLVFPVDQLRIVAHRWDDITSVDIVNHWLDAVPDNPDNSGYVGLLVVSRTHKEIFRKQ